MSDYYLEDKARLNCQPKRTIADYVEQNGILVPRRFDTLNEAKASDVEIFLRSEHPQDYDGVSGMLHSIHLRPVGHRGVEKPSSLEEAKEQYFAYLKKRIKQNKRVEYLDYCNVTGINEEELWSDVSFSAWEFIDGRNRVVTKDNAIPDRWHVMSMDRMKGCRIEAYSVVEAGEIVLQYVSRSADVPESGLSRLIEAYEAVRTLDRFDQDHCPIMEFVSTDESDYFVQYIRGRDFDPAEFVLDREPEEGEHEAVFTMGHTSEEGRTFKVTCLHAGIRTGRYDAGIEEGANDRHYNYMFSDVQARLREVQLIGASRRELPGLFLDIAVNHESRSRLLKPRRVVIQDSAQITSQEELLEYYQRIRETGQNQYIDLHITSDGRRAFVKRI